MRSRGLNSEAPWKAARISSTPASAARKTRPSGASGTARAQERRSSAMSAALSASLGPSR